MMVVVYLVSKSCLILATPWTVVCLPSLSMGFLRQEYWSGLPLPSPGNLLDPGIELMAPACQAVSCITGTFFITEPPGKPLSQRSVKFIFPLEKAN